jgi:TRAP-type mannitol/chloroaromatic compound transport system permease small subunit
MPPDPDTARTGWPDRIAGAWGLLVDGLGALGTVLILGLMALICADVVARNLTGASLPMVAEAGALTVVLIVYLQLATTIRHDRLARTDLFYGGFRQRFPRAGALLAAVYDAVGAAALGMVAWSTVTIVERNFSRGEYIGVPGIATLPTWPFRALILLGMTVAAVQCAIQVLRALRQMIRPEART